MAVDQELANGCVLFVMVDVALASAAVDETVVEHCRKHVVEDVRTHARPTRRVLVFA